MNRLSHTAALLCAASPWLAMAQPFPINPQPFVEQQRQQERERAVREANERNIDLHLQSPALTLPSRIPATESPCFAIDRIVLIGEQAASFQWAVSPTVLAGPSGDDAPLGRCLGAGGVNAVLSRAQAELISRGWTTTRVLAPAQDLTSGTLTLTLVPGRVAAIRLSPDSTVPWLGEFALLASAIPARPGDLLNLRDIEQGLENLQRVATVEAGIEIEPSTAPGARPGDSDLVVTYIQRRKVRLALNLDDSGTEATGRYQSGVTVSLDNPTGLNDLLYVNANHHIGRRFFEDDGKGTESQTVHYSVPYGRWMLSVTASNSQYFQTVEGASQDYIFAGKSDNAELKLSRLVWRDQHRKSTVSVRGWRRESRNFIDDAEIDVQHRVTGGWELAFNHREFIGHTVLDGTLAYRRGTGAFGAKPAPEEAFGEGVSRMKLYTADFNAQAPFKVGEEKLRYTGLVRAQWNRTPLVPQDRFAIGGRYSVRGFDGEASLMAERGWLVRNELAWAMGQSGAEVYMGLDHGHVGGATARSLPGSHLAGAALGVRGAWRKTSYDVFVGAPVRKPQGFNTGRYTVGFSLGAGF